MPRDSSHEDRPITGIIRELRPLPQLSTPEKMLGETSRRKRIEKENHTMHAIEKATKHTHAKHGKDKVLTCESDSSQEEFDDLICQNLSIVEEQETID